MNARRGCVPEDDRNFSFSAIETMRTASRHIDYLINEGYDLKMASTFVGNHFLLSERQRLAIVRSLATKEQLDIRKAKEKTTAAGSEVWIDGLRCLPGKIMNLQHSGLWYYTYPCIFDMCA